VIGHRIESGARATAIAFLWGDVRRPDAAFAWLSFRCYFADLALEGENIDDRERKVPGHHADEEDAVKQQLRSATADAAEGGEDEHHDGVGGQGQNSELLLFKDGRRPEFIPWVSMGRRELSAFSRLICPLLCF
jgi:hypothetical protein